MSKWREISAIVIHETLEQTRGQPPEVVRKALRDAYPFGERKWHPYKIWLSEIKKQTRGKFSRPKQEPPLELWAGVNEESAK